jgi:hypothetical protein
MTARKAVFGLCAVCALLISAFAAQSAMAVTQTGITCTNTGTPLNNDRFTKEHCKEGDKGGGEFFHAAWTAGGVEVQNTEGTAANFLTGEEREVFEFEMTIGGLQVILSAKKVMSNHTLKNGLAGAEMFLEGKTNLIVFEGVTVTNRNCEVWGIPPGGGASTPEKVETQPVEGSTLGQAKGVVLFKPQVGAKFAEFEIKGVNCPQALRGLYPVFGQVFSDPAEGATLPFSFGTVTGQPEPKLRVKNAAAGPIAGVQGRITFRDGPVGSAESTWRPISIT